MANLAELHDAPKVDLSISAPLQEVLARCEQIHSDDKQAERRKKIVLVVGITGAIVLFFITMFAFESPFVFMGVFFLGFIGVMLLYQRVGAADIEDRKLEVVDSVLRALGPELRSNRPVKVDVDFSAYTHSDGNHEWLKLELGLQDGTAVRVQGVTSFKRKTRAKRKYTKIKDKLIDRLIVTLSPPKGRAFDPQAKLRANQRVGGLRVRRWSVKPRAARVEFETGRMMRVRGRGGWTGVGLEGQLDGQSTLLGIMASYRMLAASNRGAA
ncbi:MAG: hypothetical protein H6713_26750 [Myxococcales bacterium]|nr:hypothetical protein [Myxococcales bacterium]MCB9753558.1 hypothetical protein [Myxococcales bacterium]